MDTPEQNVVDAVATYAEPFHGIEDADIDPLLRRIGDAKVVLLGESTHGTSEFYRLRTRITDALVADKGFSAVALTADGPDMAWVDHHVRRSRAPATSWEPFARYPTWRWRNRETRGLVALLLARNRGRAPDDRVSVHGLDAHGWTLGIDFALDHLSHADAMAAHIARERFARFDTYPGDPNLYRHAPTSEGHTALEDAVVTKLLERAHDWRTLCREVYGPESPGPADPLVHDIEAYFRALYRGDRTTWNIRQSHMFDTLKGIRENDPDTKVVVWAHNDHIARHDTVMVDRGDTNLGRLARKVWNDEVHAVGFGTHKGHVAAAHHYDGPGGTYRLPEARPDSHERTFKTTGIPSFFLPLDPGLWDHGPADPCVSRSIGTVFRPASERRHAYHKAPLVGRYDTYCWFDRSQSVVPLEVDAIDAPGHHMIPA